jgi:lipopolysaccharide/colanic/teichoic acid biosynthesis glycosyltransferase
MAGGRILGDERGAALDLDLGVSERFVYEAAKRLLDLIVAIPAFLLSLPIIVVLAIMIRADSPGPVVFRQVRVAKGGGTFHFYKFRTMQVDARKKFPELYKYQYDPETIRTMRFKLIDDPRLTRVGSYLRRTSLDELPNLLNVITGQVSLVGPRPEIPEMLPYYEDWQRAKFSVKPGVTGLAQVGGRGLLTFQDTIAADLRYVGQRSFWLDLRVIFQTVVEIVKRQGAF